MTGSDQVIVYQIFLLCISTGGTDWEKNPTKLPRDRSQSGKTLQQIKAAVYGDRPAWRTNGKTEWAVQTRVFPQHYCLVALSSCSITSGEKINLTSLESFLKADGKLDCRALRTNGL